MGSSPSRSRTSSAPQTGTSRAAPPDGVHRTSATEGPWRGSKKQGGRRAGERAALAAGLQDGEGEPAVLQGLGDPAHVGRVAGVAHARFGVLVGVERPLVVDAHGVVGALLTGMEVQPVQGLAVRGDVLVDDDPELLQGGLLLLVLALPVAAGDRERGASAQEDQASEDDQTGHRGPARGAVAAAAAGPGGRGAALGLVDGPVDEGVELGHGVRVRAGCLDGGDEVVDGPDRHHLRVGARVEAVAEAYRVDAGDTGVGAQVLQEVLRRVLGRRGEHGHEDRFVGVLDLLLQGGLLGRRELAGGRRVDVHGALAQGARRVVDRGGGGLGSGCHRQHGRREYQQQAGPQGCEQPIPHTPKVTRTGDGCVARPGSVSAFTRRGTPCAASPRRRSDHR